MVRLDSYRRFSWIQFIGVRRNCFKKRKSKSNLKELLPLQRNLDLDDAKKINLDELPLQLPLPHDVIPLIFSKLSFLSLQSCRLVCKAWKNLVLNCKFHPGPISTSNNNLFFAHISPFCKLSYVDLDPKHLEGINTLASFTFRPDLSSTAYISIINSANGLLCCSLGCKTTERRIICILNPMTNEYLRVPSTDPDHTYGLGFSPKTKQYKLARISSVHHKPTSKFRTLVEIFAFGSKTTSSPQWATVGFVPFCMDDHCAYFNGALYWSADLRNGIYRLDIEDEKLEEIYLPRPRGHSFHFGVLNGALYLTFCVSRKFKYHVWKMEDDFSWTRAFVIVIRGNFRYPRSFGHIFDHCHDSLPSCYLQLIKICKDGKILCLFDGFDLILYDPATESIEILTHQDVKTKKYLFLHQIDSFNFGSLPNILAGAGDA